MNVMKLKCAVIGMGMLGSQHAKYLSGHESTEVVAVCDIKPDKAEQFAKEHGAKVYTDVQKMLDEIHPDLVVVATQDPYHKAPLVAACNAGVKYIISEKPLTTTVEDAKEVAKAAEKSGTIIKVLFPNRFYPLDRAIRSLLMGGYLGEPQYGEMRMDDAISVPLRLWGKDSKTFAKISSPAFFLLSHAVDLLHYYFAPHQIKKVYAIGKQGVIGSDVDFVDSFLTFDNGLVIRLKTEWTKRLDGLVENYVQLTAEKGGFAFNKTPGFECKQALRIAIDGGKEKNEEAAKVLEGEGIRCTIQQTRDGEDYALLLDTANGNDFDWNMGVCHYADSFLGTADTPVEMTDLKGGLQQVAVVDAILRSAKEGKEVAVEPIL